MFEETGKRRSPLILIGGAEDKQGSMSILTRVMDVSAATHIVVIPTASSYPREAFENYYDAFRKLGAEAVDCFDIRYKEDADREDYFEKLSKAQLVFFSGGDQVKLVESIEGSGLLAEIKRRFYTGTLTIAGTSAGAAAVSDPMIYDGDYKGFIKGTVNHGKGFGFINDITIDTHFLHRERIPRLVQFLASGLSAKGIGIDEDTGIIIDPELRCEVIGSSMVTLINIDKVTYNDFHDVEERHTFNINNVRIGFLSNGATFNLRRWAVSKPRDRKKKEWDDVEDMEVVYPGAYI